MNKNGVFILGTVGLIAYYFFTKKDAVPVTDEAVDSGGVPQSTYDAIEANWHVNGSVVQPGTPEYDWVTWLASIPGTTQSDVDIYAGGTMNSGDLGSWVRYIRDWYLKGRKMMLDSPMDYDMTVSWSAQTPVDPGHIRTIMLAHPQLQRFGGLVQ